MRRQNQSDSSRKFEIQNELKWSTKTKTVKRYGQKLSYSENNFTTLPCLVYCRNWQCPLPLPLLAITCQRCQNRQRRYFSKFSQNFTNFSIKLLIVAICGNDRALFMHQINENTLRDRLVKKKSKKIHAGSASCRFCAYRQYQKSQRKIDSPLTLCWLLRVAPTLRQMWVQHNVVLFISNPFM